MSLIVDHISRKLGVPTEEAARLVDELVAGLLQDLEADGTANVRGLGTFALAGGEIHFTPEPRLAAVVNHRFAGLYPIPIDTEESDSLGLGSSYGVPDIPIASEVFSEPAEGAETQQDASGTAVDDEPVDEHTESEPPHPPTVYYAPEDDESLIDIAESNVSTSWERTRDVVDTVRHAVESDEVTETTDQDSGDVPVDEDSDTGVSWNRPTRFHETETANDELDDDYLAETEFERETEHEPDFGATLVHPARPTEDVAPDDEVGGHTPSPDDNTPADDTEEPQEPRVEVRRSRIARTYWLAIPLLVVSIAAVLWLLQQGERAPQRSSVPADRTESLVQESGVASESETDAADAPSEAPPPQLSAAETWQPGSVNKRAGGYTIVVSSQASTQEAIDFARSVVSRLEEERLPIDIYRGTTDRRTRYRVGVGQFETIQTAITEMDRLTSRLPDGAWILRIRSNM